MALYPGPLFFLVLVPQSLLTDPFVPFSLNQIYKSKTGLKLLFSAGYVHRDFSTGNLICFRDGSCKISDFEYAQPCFLSLSQAPDAETGATGEGWKIVSY